MLDLTLDLANDREEMLNGKDAANIRESLSSQGADLDDTRDRIESIFRSLLLSPLFE